MKPFIKLFLIGLLAVTFAFSADFVPSSRYFDNNLIAQWHFLKEKKKVRRELANIMEVLNEYYSRKPLECREELAHYIQRVCRENGLPPPLLLAVIFTESSFREQARSQQGAIGLMQLLPATGYALSKELEIEWRGHETLYDIRHNIRMGAYYLKKMVKRFNDIDMALTAYNAGPTRVLKYARNGKSYSQTYARKVASKCQMLMNNYFRIESIM